VTLQKQGCPVDEMLTQLIIKVLTIYCRVCSYIISICYTSFQPTCSFQIASGISIGFNILNHSYPCFYVVVYDSNLCCYTNESTQVQNPQHSGLT